MKKYLYLSLLGIFFAMSVLPLAAQKPTGNLNGIITPQIQNQAAAEAQQSTTTRSQNTAGSSSSGTPCNGTIEAGVCIPTNTGLSSAPVKNILITFMNWLLGIVGMLAVIAFVISGIQYMTSVGDSKMIETAKKNMLNSIIGVIVALSGFVILQAIDTLLNTPADNIF